MSAKEVVKLLSKEKLMIATAESLTAGLLASKIAEIPGVSKTLRGGIVAYQNEIKQGVLGVNKETLKTYGAISEQTAIEMAQAAARIFKSQVGVATTGVAGPKESEGKPVGTVFIAVCINGVGVAEKFHLTGSREQIRQSTCALALEFTRDKLLEM